MKRFQFRLETVHKERIRVEQLKLKEWSIVNRMLADLHQEEQHLKARLAEAIHQMGNVLAQREMTSGLLVELDKFIFSIKTQLEWKRSQISRAEKFVEKKRMEWLKSRTEKRVLDQLKEKKWVEFKREKQRREQYELDDLNVMRARLIRVDEADHSSQGEIDEDEPKPVVHIEDV